MRRAVSYYAAYIACLQVSISIPKTVNRSLILSRSHNKAETKVKYIDFVNKTCYQVINETSILILDCSVNVIWKKLTAKIFTFNRKARSRKARLYITNV